MKKLIKILIFAFGSLVGLTLIAVVAVSVAVYDTTDNTPAAIREANADLETLINRQAVAALAGAEEKSEVGFLLNEYHMNEIVYAITREIKLPLVRLGGAYVKYAENGAIQAEIPIKFLGMIPTCVKARVRISYVDNVLSVTVESASVGNLDLSSGVLKALFLSEASGKKWRAELADSGIFMSLDMRTLTAKMTFDEIEKTVATLTYGDKNALLYSLVLSLALRDESLIGFSFGEEGLYGVTLKTDNISYDPAADGDIAYPVDFAAAKDKTLEKLRSGIEAARSPLLFRYCVSGYEALSESEKAAADELGLDKRESGVRSVNKLTMAQVLLDQTGGLEASLLNRAATVTVTERQLNAIMAGLDVIGAGTAFYDGSDLSYLALEGITAKISDGNLRVAVVFNLNGKRLCGYIDSACPDSAKLAVDAQINVLRLGRIDLTDRDVSLFLGYTDAVLSDENWIYADLDASTLTIDMQAALEKVSEYAYLMKVYSDVSMRLKVVSGKGQLQMVFRLI